MNYHRLFLQKKVVPHSVGVVGFFVFLKIYENLALKKVIFDGIGSLSKRIVPFLLCACYLWSLKASFLSPVKICFLNSHCLDIYIGLLFIDNQIDRCRP